MGRVGRDTGGTGHAPGAGRGRGPRFNVAGVALVSVAHVVDDMYQGVVPALLPFLVAERHYTYAAISGITLAATVLSSVAQPLFGIWADRRPRRWLIGSGILLAGLGVAVSGWTGHYLTTWLAIAASGLGVAAFHPEAARAARQAAGRSNTGMSIFALGGNIGFAAGSAVATPVLLAVGLRGTALLALPAVVMALILARHLGGTLDRPTRSGTVPQLPTGRDDWRSFATLTGVVVIRSIVFFGMSSFIAVYFIDHFGTSQAVGGAALTVFLVTGAVGTVVGGWLGDRFHPLVPIRSGLVLAVPALGLLVLTDSTPVAFGAVAAIGISLYLPFSVFVLLGQDYLPHRIGTASGVTVGLAVSIGGLFNPVLGLLADHSGLHMMFTVLIALPVVAVAIAARLRLPGAYDVVPGSGVTPGDEPGGDHVRDGDGGGDEGP